MKKCRSETVLFKFKCYISSFFWGMFNICCILQMTSWTNYKYLDNARYLNYILVSVYVNIKQTTLSLKTSSFKSIQKNEYKR